VNDGPFWFTTSAVRQGVKVPGWKQLIANGKDATSSFTASRQRFEPLYTTSWRWEKNPSAPNGKRTIYEPGYVTILHAILAANRGSLNPDETTANNAALRKAYQGIRSSRTKLQGLTVLGELGKTIEGIRKPAQAIRKLLDGHIVRCRKATKKFSRPGDVAKAWAGSWLEFNYGWVPLSNDVASAVDALDDVFSDTFPTQRIKASGIDTAKRIYSGVHQNQWKYQDNGEKSIIIRYTVGLKYDRSDAGYQSLRSWQDRFGLRLDEFLPTAWELAPWSFLVDYFTNVGDLVDAVSTSTEKVVFVNKTRRIFERWETHINLDFDSIKKADAGYSSELYVSGPVNKIITETSSVLRGPSVLGLPSFQLSLPSIHQWTNIGALITQATAITGRNQVLRRGRLVSHRVL